MRPSAPLMLLCVMALSGCAAFAPQPPIAAAPAVPDPAAAMLTEAALRAERSLAALALVLPAQPPDAAMPPPDTVPAALRRPVTLDWIGPLGTVAEDLARRAGYRFLAAGPVPGAPVHRRHRGRPGAAHRGAARCRAPGPAMPPPWLSTPGGGRCASTGPRRHAPRQRSRADDGRLSIPDFFSTPPPDDGILRVRPFVARSGKHRLCNLGPPGLRTRRPI